MNEILTKEELDIAKEVINIGLGKAADSMAFFTKDQVFIKGINLEIKSKKTILNLTQKRDDELLYVLTTELKGEIGGVCYLIFSEAEVSEILKVSLPPSIMDDKEKLDVMTEAVLLEMDNIIVASVITQFSNFFKYKMFGDVPQLTKCLGEGFTNIVKSATNNIDYVLHFKSDFNTVGLNINPEFVWLMDEKYIEGVKKIAQNQKLLKG